MNDIRITILSIYILAKILSVGIMFYIMPILFDQSIFKMPDFNYYSSGDLGPGPNIGYRWLIWLLNINSLEELLPISLSILINLLVEISWINLFSKYLRTSTLLLFAILIGAHPYMATYFLKFSSDIFSKIGLLLIVISILSIRHSDIHSKTVSNMKLTWEWSVWFILISLRNSNALLAIPYLFIKNLSNKIRASFVSFSLLIYLFYISQGYMDGLKPFNRPWDLNYLEQVFGTNNFIFLLIISLIARILMLFGAREKVYVEGIEPFFFPGGEISLELYGYALIGLFQFFGFIVGIYFLYKKFNSKMIYLIIIPLILSILTVSHQRYLLPYIPICCFGLILLVQKILYRKAE